MAKGHRSQIKKERNIATQEKRPHATAKYVGIPAPKAKIVLDQIKGKDVATAAAMLNYSPRLAAEIIGKVLKSAVANAENNLGMDVSKLYVEEVSADQGPTMKRIRPRAQGRAYRILKRSCHISIILNEIRRYEMGQKVNPHGLRVGIIKDWDAKWYAEKDFADNLVEDVKIRKFIKKRLYDAGISKITIERTAGRVKISVYTAKPGIVIGKNGASIEALKAELQKMTAQKVAVNIEEVKRPELDAQLVAENIALQLENRVTFRRAMKQAMGRTMKFGAKGIKTMVSGRLGGADIARGESYHEGTIPLQTLRADIDYGFAEADTTYGKLGVKVWIYKGEVLPVKNNKK